MKSPFVLCTLHNGDISLFRDLASLESYVEPIDVLNGEFEAFDASGFAVELKANDRWGKVTATMTSRLRESYLRQLILERFSESSSIKACSNLAELIEALKLIYPGYA